MNKDIINMDSSRQRKEQISKADRDSSYMQKYPSHVQGHAIYVQRNSLSPSDVENSSQNCLNMGGKLTCSLNTLTA